MPIESLLAFWIVSAMLVVTPGADWAYVIAAGIQGRAAPATMGLLSGHLTATAIVAGGVGTAVGAAPQLLLVLTALGCGYLIWLGIGMLRSPPALAVDADVRKVRGRAWLLKGLGVSGLNPKVFLLFLAVLPQFASPAADWPVSTQLVALGLTHVATCAVVYAIVGASARSLLRGRPTAARTVGRVTGIAMIVVAVTLLIAELTA